MSTVTFSGSQPMTAAEPAFDHKVTVITRHDGLQEVRWQERVWGGLFVRERVARLPEPVARALADSHARFYGLKLMAAKP